MPAETDGLGSSVRAGCAYGEQRYRLPPFEKQYELLRWAPTIPARCRIRNNDGSIEYFTPSENKTLFLDHQLSVSRLDSIADSLWIAGIRNSIRPLHRHFAMHRRVVITEDPGLHLLWRLNEIFIKPIPPALMHYDTFKQLLCKDGEPSLDSPYYGALGLLSSYAKLVVFESDLRIAQEHGLIPGEVTYSQWVAFVSSFLKQSAGSILPPRYAFGELRLPRVNLIYRFKLGLFPNHIIRGYFSDYDRYDTFFESKFRWLLVVFAYISVILNGLQVGLQSEKSQEAERFNIVAWTISITSLFVVAGGVALILILAVMFFIVNSVFAVRMEYKIKTRLRLHMP